MTYEVVSSEERYAGTYFTVRTDRIVMPDGTVAARDLVAHPGAVGAVLVDDDLRVLLIRQHRAAVGHALWEVPAGLRDVAGEEPEATARRELFEETGWTAESWAHLLTIHPTPGWTNERYEVYLARGPRESAEPRDLHGEEQDLELRWVPMDAAVEWVLDGRVTNGMCVAGVLAAARVLGV